MTACGGGGDGGEIKSYPSLTINGTAATGAPIANAPLILNCAGEVSGTYYTYFDNTDADGAYSKRVDAALAPCIISVTFTDSDGTTQTLSTFAKELTNQTTANITPLTNAMLSATMGTPTSVYSMTTGSTTLSKLATATSQGLDRVAWDTLNSNLRKRGLNTSAIQISPISDYFSADAAHLSQGYDKLLDDLKTINLSSSQLYQYAGGVNQFEAVALTNDSEVHDKLTGLIWKRCVEGKVWDGTTCSGTQALYYWSELPQLIANMPRSSAIDAKPWRLPTYKELATLHDGSASARPYVIDKKWFPATASNWTWTSTPPTTTGPTLMAKVIGFQKNVIGNYVGESTDQLVTRLVR